MAAMQQSLLMSNSSKKWELSRKHLFSNNYRGVTTTPDGSLMIACMTSGGMMKSTDYGETWGFVGLSVVATDIAISSTGQYIYVSHINGVIRSTNFGANWSSIKTTGSYSSVCCSSNGFIVAACLVSGNIDVSTNTGNSWVVRAISRNWSKIRCSPNGQFMVAVSNGGAFTSSNTGASWTSRLAGNFGSCSISANGVYIVVGIMSGRIYVSSNSGASFTARGYTNSRYWMDIKCSEDGSVMFATGYTGANAAINVYKSIDYGVTWFNLPLGINGRGVSFTADYATVLAVSVDQQLYISKDSGGTWAARCQLNSSWTSSASNGTGSLFTVMGGKNEIYTSSDFGTTWLLRRNSVVGGEVTTNPSGSIIYAAPFGSLIIYSTTQGVSWTSQNSVTNRNWYGIDCSSDGTKAVAVVLSGQIWTSINSGVDWVARETNRAWTDVACSFDFTKMIACVQNGLTYTSSDSGVTWTPGTLTKNWKEVDMASDGSILIAVALDDCIYKSTDFGVTWIPISGVGKWNTVNVSDDGTKIIVGEFPGNIHTSLNGGVSWTITEFYQSWRSIHCNSSFDKFIAIGSGYPFVGLLK